MPLESPQDVQALIEFGASLSQRSVGRSRYEASTRDLANYLYYIGAVCPESFRPMQEAVVALPVAQLSEPGFRPPRAAPFATAAGRRPPACAGTPPRWSVWPVVPAGARMGGSDRLPRTTSSVLRRAAVKRSRGETHERIVDGVRSACVGVLFRAARARAGPSGANVRGCQVRGLRIQRA
jgi:hypothetical protein